ncbi:MAG: hypothetical protein JST40_13385 [Armatimonadetes bacterium]|nr:hypothetical protein [Armatimonadota bacterium]
MKKVGKFLIVVLTVSILYAGFRFGPDLVAVYKAGFLDKIEKREYQASRLGNLEAMQTAMLLYLDSEGAFPPADLWMEAIEPRLKTADLKEGEAAKKMIRPDFEPNSGSYGYAYNTQCAGKYTDDLPQKDKTILIFESTEAKRDAHGDPHTAGLKKGKGITISGDVVEVSAK